MDQSARILELFSLQNFPNASDENINLIESFLISGFDDAVKQHIHKIIEFLCSNLPMRSDYQMSTPPSTIEKQMRCLELIHITKPTYLDKNLSSIIEDKLLKIIQYEGKLQLQAFSVLVDHFGMAPRGSPDRCGEFLKFYQGYLKLAVDDVMKVNANLILLILASFNSVLSMLEKHDENTIMTYYDILIRIALNCISYSDRIEFFPYLEQICAKSLRVITRICEIVHNMRPQALQYLIDLGSKISGDIKFTHIYLNYLSALATIYSQNDDKNTLVSQIVETNLIKNLKYFTAKPLVNQRRFFYILLNLSKGINERYLNNQDDAEELLSNVYDLLSNKIGQAVQLLRKVWEIWKTMPHKLAEILEQLMSILELIQNEYSENPEQWAEINTFIIRMMKPLFEQSFNPNIDEKNSKMDVLVRFTQYIAFLLDIMGQMITNNNKDVTIINGKQFPGQNKNLRRTLNDIFQIYCDIISKLPAEWSPAFFDDNIEYFVPKENHHVFHMYVVDRFLAKMQNPFSFLNAITNHLINHLPNISHPYCELIYKIYLHAFLQDSQLNISPEQNEQLCNSIFNLYLEALNKSATELTEMVLISLFKVYSRKPTNSRLVPFIQMLNKSGVNWFAALLPLQPEITYSRFAINLFAVLDSPKNIDAWFTLFLPVLENIDEKKKDLVSFSIVVKSKNLFSLFKDLKKATKFRLLNALSHILSQSTNPQEIEYLRQLLNTIADFLPAAAEEQQSIKSNYHTVIMNDRKYPLELVLETYKESKKDELLQFMFNLVLTAFEQMTYHEITLSKVIREMITIIKEKNIQLFENKLPMNYSGYYFYYFIYNLINVPTEQIYDFLHSSSFLFFNVDTVKTALELTDLLIEQVPFGEQWLTLIAPILQSSQNEFKLGYDIINRHLFQPYANNKTAEEIFSDMYKNCFVLSRRPSYSVRKIVNPCLIALGQFECIQKMFPKQRSDILTKIGKLLSNPNALFTQIRIYFNFLRSFEDCTYQQELFDVFYNYITNQQPPEEPFLYYSEKYQAKIIHLISHGNPMDPSIAQFKQISFLFKVVARLAVSTQNEQLANLIYTKTFMLFNEKKNRPYLPGFLKALNKSVQTGIGTFNFMPQDITKLVHFSLTPKTKPSKSEIRIIKFLMSSNVNYQSYNISSYIVSVCSILKTERSQLKQQTILWYADNIFEIIKIISQNQKNNMQLIASVVDLVLSLRISRPQIKINPTKAFAALEKDAAPYVFQMLLKENSTVVFMMLQEYSNVPELFNFYFNGLMHLKMNLGTLQQLKENASFNIFDFTNRLFKVIGAVISIQNLEAQNLKELMKVALAVYQLAFKENSHFKPSILVSLLKILLPEEINAENNNSSINGIYLSNIYFFLHKPQAFMHDVVIRKIANLLAKTPQNNGVVPIIIEKIKNANPYIKTFFNHILSEFYKISPPQNPIEFTIGEAPVNEILLKYIYSYSTAILHQYENVKIVDVMSTPLLHISANVHKALIIKKDVDESSCITTNRLVHMINSGHLNAELLKERLLRFPFFNLHSQNILRCMSQYKNNYPLGEDWFARFLVGILLSFASENESVYSKSAVKRFVAYFKPVSAIPKKYKPPLMSILCHFFLTIKDQAMSIMPSILTEITSDVEPHEISLDLIKQLREMISPIPQGKPQEILSQLSLKYLLLSPLAKIVFYDHEYFPQILMLSQILKATQNHDILVYYKYALKDSVKYGGEYVSSRILTDVSDYLKSLNKVIAPIQATPFSTVIRWSIDNASDQSLNKILDSLLEAFKPQSAAHLVLEIPRLPIPLPTSIYANIEKLVDEYKPVLKRPQLMFYGTQSAGDQFESAIWNNAWSLQIPNSHIYIFAQLFFPQEISKVVNYMNEQRLKTILIIGLEVVAQQLNRFIRYYINMFPTTSLADVFYSTILYAHDLPLPSKSVFANVEYLNNVTMPDDAFGAIINDSGKFRIPLGYHMLCHFEAARGCYLNEMEDNEKDYPLGLFLLRPCVLNLDFASMDSNQLQTYINLPSISSYALNLPMIKLFTPENELHAAVKSIYYPNSRFFLPSLTAVQRLTIFEECIALLRCVSKAPIDQMGIAKWTTMGVNSLDKNCTIISNIGFKINQIRAREKQLARSAQNFAFVNTNFASILLSSSYAMKKAVKLFVISLMPPEINHAILMLPNPQQPQTQPQPPQPPQAIDLRYGMQVLSQNIPRLYNMFTKLPMHNAQTIPALKTRLEYFLTLHDMSSFMKQFQNKQLSNPSYHLKLLMFIFANLPTELNIQAIYQVLSQRIIPQSIVPQSLEYTNMAIALAFAMVRKFPQSVNLFYQNILGQFKPDQTSVWFIWLPHIFSVFDNPPTDFLKKIMSADQHRFKAILRNALGCESAKNPKNLEEIARALSKTQEGANLNEYDQSLVWANEIEGDIEAYNTAVEVHLRLAEEIAGSHDISPVVKSITGENVLEYVLQHPPYFKTDMTAIEPKGSSHFRFPMLNSQCFHADIYAPGDREARITFTMMNGQNISFSLLSSMMFKPNFSEEIFLYCTRLFIRNHPAFKFRSFFIAHPQLYYIHKQLLLVSGGSYIGLGELARTKIVAELLKREGMKGVEPMAVKSRKPLADNPRKVIFDWISENSEGNRLDFIFMRQQIASHIAAISALKFLFMSGYPQYPNMIFSTNRCRVAMPRLTHNNHKVVHLPLTPTISEFLPPYLLRGSFSSTWLLMMESMNRSIDKLRICIKALIEHGEKSAEVVTDRVKKSTLAETEDTEKEQYPMAFALLDHLINVSGNAFNCQETGFAWI